MNLCTLIMGKIFMQSFENYEAPTCGSQTRVVNRVSYSHLGEVGVDLKVSILDPLRLSYFNMFAIVC